MKRVFVDMDGVIVDFDSYRKKFGATGDEIKKRSGAYLDMQPYPDGLAGVRSLIGMGYEVWIATKPPTGIAFAYADKAAWVMKYLPELRRRIIITHDKGLLGDAGDFLIDDRPHKANCEKFSGTLIRFTDGKTWADVLNEFRSIAVVPA
jgi:5'(3')-deoxyribonucleotidase